MPVIKPSPGTHQTIPMLVPGLFAMLLAAALACTGCGGATKAQKRAYRADEAVSRERLRLVEEYERCLREAGGDRNAAEACERFLKSAEALK